MFTNHRAPPERPPVLLECKACGHLGCDCQPSDDPAWWAKVICPACGHVEYCLPRPTQTKG